MIRRIVGSNQVATPTDQMGTPPDPIKSKMANPPEPVKTNEQIQSDAGIAQSLQQNALEKAGDQRVQASLLQAELLRKLGAPPDPEADRERLMNGIKDRKDLQAQDIEKDVDGFLTTDSERLMISVKDTKAFDPQPEPPVMPDLQNKL